MYKLQDIILSSMEPTLMSLMKFFLLHRNIVTPVKSAIIKPIIIGLILHISVIERVIVFTCIVIKPQIYEIIIKIAYIIARPFLPMPSFI